MAQPWIGVQKLAVVPTFDRLVDTAQPPSDWDSLIMRRVLYDPDPVTGADRSLRSYLGAISYGRATLDAKLFPHAFSDGPSVIEAAYESLPPGHGYPFVLCVIPSANGEHRGGFFRTVNENGVKAVARVAMLAGPIVQQKRQIMGVWAMEVLHAIARLPDLYAKPSNPYPNPPMGDFDNMAFNAGTHSCAYLKSAAGWLSSNAFATHIDLKRDYALHAIGISPPPPGRFAAVQLRSRTSAQTFIVEARLKADIYERGFGSLTTGGREFRGLPAEGVIVYEVTSTAHLDQVKLISSGLTVGKTYTNNEEGFTVKVTAAIDGGMMVHVTRTADPADPRCATLRQQMADIDEKLDKDLDVNTRKALLKERGELKGRAKKLGCP